MTTTNTQTKSRNCRRTSKPLCSERSFFNFSWATSAEAYMTYFKFNRCNINLCLRPSTNAFDIASSVHNAAITYHEKRQGKKE